MTVRVRPRAPTGGSAGLRNRASHARTGGFDTRSLHHPGGRRWVSGIALQAKPCGSIPQSSTNRIPPPRPATPGRFHFGHPGDSVFADRSGDRFCPRSPPTRLFWTSRSGSITGWWMTKAEAGRLGFFAGAKARSDRAVKRRSAHEKKCGFCGKPLDYARRRNKFCGHVCSARYTNRRRTRRGTRKACELCKTQFSPTRQAQRFCSAACAVRYRREAYIAAWKAGQIAGGTWAGVSSIVRWWLLSTRGMRCERCGWAEVNTATGAVPVQVDHRDGNPNNHRPENLQILCPNCHSLTPTFGGLNRGKGRKERYAGVGQSAGSRLGTAETGVQVSPPAPN